MRFIFDLDHTSICASHRGAFDSAGNGCLRCWKQLSTPENIAKDKLLPLGEQWRWLLRKGATIVVCTSRMMQAADYDMLRAHGLGWHYMLSRTDDGEPTPQMKKRLLGTLPGGWSQVCRSSVMFDDDVNVIQYLTAHGLRVHNALTLNDWLQEPIA